MTETRSLLVRTWNIAHGRDVPPGPGYGHARRKLLAEMCAVVSEDGPDIVLLQEVPIWAGPLLREHTGMGVTLADAYGALPLAAGAALGRALPDVVRTQFEGQGQALLYGPDLLLVSTRRVLLNEHRWFRGEPRIAQLVRLRHRKLGIELAVGNVHADHGGAPAQLEKAGFVLERFARGAPMILGGDLNARMHSVGLRSLAGRGWVEDAGDVGIDHLLVRGAELEWPATRWLPQRRDVRLNGSLPLRLSDHDPVDAVVALA